MTSVLNENELRTVLDEPSIWPNLSQAAAITGVSKGTLSKQAAAGRIESSVRGFGHGQRIFPPEEVLRLGVAYQRVPETTVVERLTRFLGARLAMDVDTLHQLLHAVMAEGAGNRRSSGGSGLQHHQSAVMPAWLTEVESLRKDLTALAGTLTFTSVDDLIGTIELGPSIDEPAAWGMAW